MRRRAWRLAAAALGLALVVANPASLWAHALAHHDRGHAGRHLGSLESHQGPAQVSAPERSGDHQHARLDQAPRTPAFQVDFGLVVSLPNAALILAGPARDSASGSATFRPPAPPGHDPTRVRAPPHRSAEPRRR